MKFIREATVVIRVRRDDFKGYDKTITLSGLRVSFSIQKNLSWSTNVGVVRIYNLSQSNRNSLKDFGDEVTVYAGYERGSGLQLLYRGDTTSLSHVFDLPEIVTVLECGDGDKFVNQAHVPLSFKPQTTVRTVIETIADRMGIKLVELGDTGNLVYTQGFESAGMLKEALVRACAIAGLQWSVQNNELQVIPVTGSIREQPFLINSETGMIGIPQRFTFKSQNFFVNQSINGVITPSRPVGWKVNTLLYPQILPGARINLNSRYLGMQGIFLVQTIKHHGDTYGPLWESNMEVTQLS